MPCYVPRTFFNVKIWAFFATEVAFGVLCIALHKEYGIVFWDGDEGLALESMLAVVGGCMAFILPMQLSAAVSKNHAGLDAYKALTGDVLAFGWQVLAFVKKTPENDCEERDNIVKKIFQVLLFLPSQVKQEYRDSMLADVRKQLALTSDKRNKDFVGAILNIDVCRKTAILHMDFQKLEAGEEILALRSNCSSGMSDVEWMFLKLHILINDLHSHAPSESHDGLTGKLNDVYASWGSIGNAQAFTPPGIFSETLYMVLIIFCVFQPMTPTFLGAGWHAPWMLGVLTFFLFGIHFAGEDAANPFVKSGTSFQTVGESEKNAMIAIAQVWVKRKMILNDANGIHCSSFRL